MEFVDEWKEMSLKKCCISLEYGLGVEATEFDGINKYIRITDIDEQTNKYINLPVSPKGNLNDKYLVKENDILLARTGASTGKPYIYNKKDGKLYFAGFLIRARINPLYRSKFVFFQLLTNKYKKWVKIMSTRSGQPGINSNEYAHYNFKIPSYAEQYKIEKFLSAIDERIETQNKIINKIESLICSLRINIFNKYNWIWNKLDYYVKSGIITLKRGNVIPKHEKSEEFKYPVYSSSIHNNGLMGFNNSYMFDKELITWSVDGGGNFFYRPKHKFNVTNVCGIMEVTNKSFNYRFLTEILLAQHSKLIFDYQTKAHPSVITELYKLPNVDINVQEQIALIFDLYYEKLQKEKDILSLYKKQKAYLLQNMFI